MKKVGSMWKSLLVLAILGVFDATANDPSKWKEDHMNNKELYKDIVFEPEKWELDPSCQANEYESETCGETELICSRALFDLALRERKSGVLAGVGSLKENLQNLAKFEQLSKYYITGAPRMSYRKNANSPFDYVCCPCQLKQKEGVTTPSARMPDETCTTICDCFEPFIMPTFTQYSALLDVSEHGPQLVTAVKAYRKDPDNEAKKTEMVGFLKQTLEEARNEHIDGRNSDIDFEKSSVECKLYVDICGKPKIKEGNNDIKGDADCFPDDKALKDKE